MVAAYVDNAAAEPAVTAAVDAVDAADLGDEDAELTVGDAQDHDLAWYADAGAAVPAGIALTEFSTGYGTVGYGTVGSVAKNTIKVSANVADTVRPKIAGAKEHPGWNALRTIAGRITTPLLPDDYLKLANPLWSARELRGRVVEVRRETVDSATLVIKPGWGFSFDYQPGQYVGIGLLVDGRWRWRSYSLTSSPVKGSRHDHDHGEGHARGVPVDAPRRRGGTRARSCGWRRRRAIS